MQKFHTLLTLMMITATGLLAQSDTTQKASKPDTIKVGGITIISRTQDTGLVVTNSYPGFRDGSVVIKLGKRSKNNRLKTSWFNIDLGFGNYIDNTNYGSADARDFARAIRPGEAAYTSSDLRLRTGKSTNFNLWIVKQSYGLSKDRKFQAKWGFILESNNYRFETNNSFNADNRPFMFRDSVGFSKNKLVANYATVPLMLSFNSRPGRDRGFVVSAGVSVGYLYASRMKQISDERGKRKTRDNFDLEPWKLQYIAELGLGAVQLYGSVASRSMFSRGLDLTPYAVGIRIGEW